MNFRFLKPQHEGTSRFSEGLDRAIQRFREIRPRLTGGFAKLATMSLHDMSVKRVTSLGGKRVVFEIDSYQIDFFDVSALEISDDVVAEFGDGGGVVCLYEEWDITVEGRVDLRLLLENRGSIWVVARDVSIYDAGQKRWIWSAGQGTAEAVPLKKPMWRDRHGRKRKN
jgi:hypothetical protein